MIVPPAERKISNMSAIPSAFLASVVWVSASVNLTRAGDWHLTSYFNLQFQGVAFGHMEWHVCTSDGSILTGGNA
jgi:hypothetical protein